MKKILFYLVLLTVNAFIFVSCSSIAMYNSAELTKAISEHQRNPSPENALLLKEAQRNAGKVMIYSQIVALAILVLANVIVLKGARRIRTMLRNRRQIALHDSSEAENIKPPPEE